MKKLIKELRSFFEKDNVSEKLNNYSKLVEEPNFWQNKRKAEKILKEKNNLEKLLKNYKLITSESKDLFDIYELALDEENNEIINETEVNIKELFNKVKQLEIKCFLSNEHDTFDSYLEFHAGAGGTESQDWAEMLRRMYLKWASNKKFKTQLISEHKGEEAGIAERSRLAGFRNAMKDHGLDPEPVLHGKVGYGQSQEISARQIVGGWLMQYENKLPCDGIICFVDDMAHGAYWALQEAKVRDEAFRPATRSSRAGRLISL